MRNSRRSPCSWLSCKVAWADMMRRLLRIRCGRKKTHPPLIVLGCLGWRSCTVTRAAACWSGTGSQLHVLRRLLLQALEKLDLDAATAAVLLNNAASEGMAGAPLGAQPKAQLKEALRRLDTLMEKAAGPSQTVAAALQTRLSSKQQETILCNRCAR